MKFKRRSKPEEDINLTPLIDVVFLLLIFFMISTTFTKETHMTIDLPEAESQAILKKDKTLEIVISAVGEYTVNTQSLINNQMSTLRAALD